MTTDKANAEQAWHVVGVEGSHVEHSTRGGFKAASPQAAQWAAVLLNEDYQALLDTVAALEWALDADPAYEDFEEELAKAKVTLARAMEVIGDI